MKKHLFTASLLFLVLSVSAFWGCGVSKQSTKKEVKFYLPTYIWNPPDTVSTKSSDLTIAIISPQYSSNANWVNIPLFKTFVQRIGNNFQELLIAKGFGVKGPYKNIDEMTFPDKKGSDLGIYPEIELYLDISRLPVLRKKEYPPLLSFKSKSYYTYYRDGVISLSGSINLVIIETLTGEKMWTRSINLLPVRVRAISSYATRSYPRNVDFTDTGINNPVAKAVERYFNQILNKAWSYISVEEMQLVKKQSLEIRKKKVY